MTILIGDITAGGQSDFFAPADEVAAPYVCALSGTVDTMRCIWRGTGPASNVTVTFGIWADSAGSPGALLGQSNPMTIPTSATDRGIFSGTMFSGVAVTSGTTYQIGWYVGTGANLNTYNNASGSYKGRSGDAAITNPFGAIQWTNTVAVAITGESTSADNTTKPATLGMFTPQLRQDGWF